MVDKLHSRWGCRLIGKQHDLEFLDQMLSEYIRDDSGFFVSDVESLFVLRTRQWDNEDNVMVAADRAASDLKIISGGLAMCRHTNPIKCGGIAEFASNGKLIEQHLNARFTIPEAIKDIPPKLFGRLVDSKDKNIREALYHFGDRMNWSSIFMTYESLREYYSTEKKFYQSFRHLKKHLNLIRRTANQYRHAFKAGDNLDNPIGHGGALIVLRDVFISIAEGLPPRPVNDFGKEGYIKDSYSNATGFLTIGLEIGAPTYKD